MKTKLFIAAIALAGISASAQTSGTGTEGTTGTNSQVNGQQNTTQAGSMTTSDTGFIRKNLVDNFLEVQLSDLGVTRGKGELKKVAKRMFAEHTQMYTDLQTAATKKNMSNVNISLASVGSSDVGTGTGGSTSTTGSGITGGSAGMAGWGNASGSGSGTTGSGIGLSGSASTNTTATINEMNGIQTLAHLQNTTGADFDKMWVSHMLTMHEAKIKELQAAQQTVTDKELSHMIKDSLEKIKIHRDLLAKLNVGTTTGK